MTTTTIAALLKRVERIEAKQITTRPSVITAEMPLTDDMVREAVTNWQQWVKDGRASVHGSHMHLREPTLTVEEWETQTAHLRGEPVH